MEKSQIKRYLLILLLFFVSTIIINTTSYLKEKHSEFAGVIQKIDFNEKKTPTVTIKGTKYSLGTSWSFNKEMEVGEYLIKTKNSINYSLIKNKSGDVIISD